MTERKGPGRPRHQDILTPAEWAIAHAIQHGMSNAQIAARRGVSRDAIKFHLGNILGKLGLARRADLLDMPLVPADSAMGRIGVMAETEGPGGLAQVSRMVRDIAASTAFYRDVVGLPHLYSFGDLAFFALGEGRLYLHQKADAGAESVLYFRVPEMMAAHAAFAARGARFSGPPHMAHRHADGTEEWLAFFLDLEERPLALMAQVGGKR